MSLACFAFFTTISIVVGGISLYSSKVYYFILVEWGEDRLLTISVGLSLSIVCSKTSILGFTSN